jgi:hypothetical protein
MAKAEGDLEGCFTRDDSDTVVIEDLYEQVQSPTDLNSLVEIRKIINPRAANFSEYDFFSQNLIDLGWMEAENKTDPESLPLQLDVCDSIVLQIEKNLTEQALYEIQGKNKNQIQTKHFSKITEIFEKSNWGQPDQQEVLLIVAGLKPRSEAYRTSLAVDIAEDYANAESLLQERLNEYNLLIERI